MKKEDFKKLKDKSSKLCQFSAEHCFLSFLVLTFIALLIGSFLFYQYSILVQRAELEITRESAQFKESLYQKVLQHWQSRGEKFEEADGKKHLDIFK